VDENRFEALVFYVSVGDVDMGEECGIEIFRVC